MALVQLFFYLITRRINDIHSGLINIQLQESIMGIATCPIKGLTLSSRSIDALEQMDQLVDSANQLAVAVSTTPLYTIFSDPRSAKDVVYNINDYDWELYGQAMEGIPNILRHKLNQVVEPMAWSSAGKESQFWKCVHASYNK